MNQCETRDAVGQRCLRPAGHSTEFVNGFGETKTSPTGAHDFGGVYPDARHTWEWLNEQKVRDEASSAAAAPRIFAFAKALGLTVDHMVALLETYDLHLLSGPAMREEIDTYKMRSALYAVRTFITCHPAVQGDWPILVGLIDSALGYAPSTKAETI